MGGDQPIHACCNNERNTYLTSSYLYKAFPFIIKKVWGNVQHRRETYHLKTEAIPFQYKTHVRCFEINQLNHNSGVYIFH